MSRAYRICVAENLKRHIEVEDGVQTRLELLDILPPEQMAEILANELAGLDFERDGNTMKRTDDDGIEIEVDLTEGTVTVRVSSDAELDLSVERSRVAWEEHAKQAEAELRRKAQKSLEAQAEAEQVRLQREVTERLEKKLGEIQSELDAATNRATAEALKTRARQLGEVQEIQEDEETGSVTIRIKV